MLIMWKRGFIWYIENGGDNDEGTSPVYRQKRNELC